MAPIKGKLMKLEESELVKNRKTKAEKTNVQLQTKSEKAKEISAEETKTKQSKNSKTSKVAAKKLTKTTKSTNDKNKSKETDEVKSLATTKTKVDKIKTNIQELPGQIFKPQASFTKETTAKPKGNKTRKTKSKKIKIKKSGISSKAKERVVKPQGKVTKVTAAVADTLVVSSEATFSELCSNRTKKELPEIEDLGSEFEDSA